MCIRDRYEVEPGSGRYWFGTPLFEEVEIDVPGGVFRVKADGMSADRKYVKGIRLNGEEYKLPYINYSDIMKGGEIVFEF